MSSLITERLLKWQKNQPCGPWRLKVFPTYRCNLDCGICIRNWHPAPDILFDELSDERWLQVVEEAAAMNVRELIIGGGGEPMIREELIRNMCMKAKEYGMEGFLQTNGTRMHPETIETLVSIGWDHITISVDGPNPSINDVIRQKGVFEKTKRTLQHLRDAKVKHKSQLPRLSIHTIVTAQNYDKLSSMVDFCLENNVSLFSASPLLENGMETTDYVLSDEQRLALPGHLSATIKKADQMGLAHSLNALLPQDDAAHAAIAGHAESSCLPPDHIAHVQCLQPWTELTIVSSGHVSPCCFFWEEQAATLRTHSLEEVWTSAYMNDLRHKMRAGRPLKYCVDCYYPSTQEHCALQFSVQETAKSRMNRKSLPVRIVNSLRKYGLRGSVKRFQQWKTIRRTLKNP